MPHSTTSDDRRDDGLSVPERQAAARDAYLMSVADGTPLTGAELGRRFSRTDRWGRYQISDAKAQASGTNSHQPTRSPAVRDVNGRSHDPTPAIRERPQSGRQPEPAPSQHNGSAPFREPTGTPETNSDRRTNADAAASRSWLDVTITLVVALVAAAASYGHMLDVALMAGEHVWIARAFPITVDGLVLAAIRRGEHGRRWLALGVAVSIAANVLAQFPEVATTAGPVVSAWPPLALYGTHRLLHHRRHPPSDERRRQP